jgi:hypothetical protein
MYVRLQFGSQTRIFLETLGRKIGPLDLVFVARLYKGIVAKMVFYMRDIKGYPQNEQNTAYISPS